MINGGTAFNVIPDSATIAGTFRVFSKKSFNTLRERIKQVIYALALDINGCMVVLANGVRARTTNIMTLP